MFTIGQSIFCLEVSEKLGSSSPIFKVEELRVFQIESTSIHLVNAAGVFIEISPNTLLDRVPTVFDCPLGFKFYLTSFSLLDECLSAAWTSLKNIFTRESSFIKDELSLLEITDPTSYLKQKQMDLLEIVHAIDEIPKEDFEQGDLNLEIVYSYSYTKVFGCELKIAFTRKLSAVEIEESSITSREVLGDFYDKALNNPSNKMLKVFSYENEMFGLEFSHTEDIYVDSANCFIQFENGGKESFLFRKFIPFSENTPLESVIDEMNKFLSEISGSLLETYYFLHEWATIFSNRSYYEFLEQSFLNN